jgi:hypothetical protein
MKSSYTNLVGLFNNPPHDQCIPELFAWVYKYALAGITDLVPTPEPFDRPYLASLHLSGSATLELASEKHEDGTIIAVSGDTAFQTLSKCI